MSISIIIVTYNNQHQIKACINSIVEEIHHIEGEIIIIQTEEHSLGGEHVLAIVDRGSSHGIQVGNRFTVWGVGDVGVGDGEELGEDDPDRKLQSGELLVLSVQKGTATCTVTKSNRELDVGNRVTSIGKSRLPTPSR